MNSIKGEKMSNLLYSLKDIQKKVDTPSGEIEILKNISFDVEKGESLALLGSSGSGKSTLLHIMGALDAPTSGNLYFEDEDLTAFTPNQKAKFRNKELGFIFQFHHLLPEFSTLENVAMQAFIAGMPNKQALSLAKEHLVKVGLEHRLNHKVTTLSGGERQRAGIARALIMQPKVLLADEPTGNLDEETGNKVMELLLDLNKEQGISLIIVTHNPIFAKLMQKSYELKFGELHAL